MAVKSPKKILVIDDDPVIVRMLEKVLARDGYVVSTALGGREGLEKAKVELPFVIVLDVLMPDMHGGEVARALRADPKTHDIPIVFLTITVNLEVDKGDAQIEIDGESYRAMAKPMHTAKFLSIIRKEVNKRIHNNQ